MNTESTATQTIPEELMERHSKVVKLIYDNGVELDRKKNVVHSILTPYGFRPMPLMQLAAMYMARMNEVSFDVAHAIAEEATERAILKQEAELAGLAPQPKPRVRPTDYLQKIRFLSDHQFDLLDHVLQTYPAAKAEPALRRALLRAKLNPSEWAVLVAQHDSDDVVGVYVVSLDDPGEVEFYSHLEQADLIYVNNMLYQHDQLLLKERREQRYLYLALQSLRTVK